jgi:hypothetical protein
MDVKINPAFVLVVIILAATNAQRISDDELEYLTEECLELGLVLSEIDYQCYDLATRRVPFWRPFGKQTAHTPITK